MARYSICPTRGRKGKGFDDRRNRTHDDLDSIRFKLPARDLRSTLWQMDRVETYARPSWSEVARASRTLRFTADPLPMFE